MMRNRSDAYHRKGKKAPAYKLHSKCKSLCENALEIIQEIVATDATLQMCFDKDMTMQNQQLRWLLIQNI